MGSKPGGSKSTRPDPTSQVSKAVVLEDKLRESLQRYEMLFKATNDVIYDLDMLSGTIIWNEALHTQYGYAKDEPAEQLEWWTSHIHPEDALHQESDLVEWFLGRETTRQSEYRFRKADGTYAYIRDRGFIQRDQDGNPLRIIGSFLDITQQKQLDRAKNEFISLVSHQLRTPLTVMRIKSEMLLDGMYGKMTDAQTRQIKDIADSSVRLIKIVGDILNVSRAELGSFVADPRDVDVNQLIRDIVAELQALAKERHVTVRVRPDRKRGIHFVDRAHFEHICHNLVTNAIRYSKPGGIVVVSLRTEAHGILLSVSDTGIGIAKADRLHIFERFFRAENTVNTKDVGTGLGLYMVRLLTEASGGKLWFESKRGQGTTFYVQIPEHTGSRRLVKKT